MELLCQRLCTFGKSWDPLLIAPSPPYCLCFFAAGCFICKFGWLSDRDTFWPQLTTLSLLFSHYIMPDLILSWINSFGPKRCLNLFQSAFPAWFEVATLPSPFSSRGHRANNPSVFFCFRELHEHSVQGTEYNGLQLVQQVSTKQVYWRIRGK